MKMQKELYRELYDAIITVVPAIRNPATYGMRQRWDALFASQYPVKKLYDAGLNDNHIDTALRNILGGKNEHS